MRLFEKFWPSKKEIKSVPPAMAFPLAHIYINERRPAAYSDDIVLPHIDLTEPMKATLFKRHHRELREMFTPSGFFNICPIRGILALSDMVLFGEAAEALDWLAQLHSVRFSDMHRDIARQIIPKINVVFGGGLE